MLSAAQAFDDVPFFWIHHQGLDLLYCGLADAWDDVRIDGDLAQHDFIARYFGGGTLIAAAAMGRDRELLSISQELQVAASA